MSEDTRDTHVYAAGDRIEKCYATVYISGPQINPVLLWKRGTFKRYEDHQTVPPEHRAVWVKIDDHLHPESAWIGRIRPLGLLELISEAARDF